MKRTFIAKEKTSIFELWKNGKGFSETAKVLESKPGNLLTMLTDTGGIKPNERRRAVAHLTLAEREEIRAGLEHTCHCGLAESLAINNLKGSSPQSRQALL